MKTYRYTKPTLVFILILCALSPLAGEWTILQDFEDQSLDGVYFSNRLTITPNDGSSHDGWSMIMPRPFDDVGGFVLGASEGTTWYNIYDVAIPLGEMSEVDDYTIYYEIAYNDDSADIVSGVGDMVTPLVVAEGEEHSWSIEEPQWGDYSILARFSRNGMDVRDINGTGYTDDYGEQVLQTWYKVWYVVHPAFYSWSMWIEGGAFAEPTQVADYHYFRKNDTMGVGPMRTLVFRLGGNSSSATTTGAPTYIDTIAVDTSGQNLTTPVVDNSGGFGAWGPYAIVDAEQNVGTEDLVGWINVSLDPYVWSYSLNSYMYIDKSTITSSGAWAYVLNAAGLPEDNQSEFGSWGPFAIVDVDANVGTGAWMGWMNVSLKPYVWNYILSDYIYMEESTITSSGAWVYLFN